MRGGNLNCAWEAEVEGEITCLDISPRRGFCGVGTRSGKVAFFDKNGKRLWERILKAPARGLCCSQNGEYVVVVSDALVLAVYKQDGELFWKRELRFEAGCLDLRPGSHMLVIGNHFGLIRFISIHGKWKDSHEVSHPINFVRFAPGGNACAAASKEGNLTLLGYGGKQLWSALLHRRILGLDVVGHGDLILTPSRNDGVVMVDIEGAGVGVYELEAPLVAAEIDDEGKTLVALDEAGKLLVLDREAKVLGFQESGVKAERIALDSSGARLALAASGGLLRCYLRSDVGDSVEFLDVSEKKGCLKHEDDRTRYLEI